MNKTQKKAVSYFLFICIIVATGLTIYIAYNPPPGERFTEFYLLGQSGKAGGYPTNLAVGESGTVILGVVNHEYEDVIYRIVVRLENITIATMDDLILDHKSGWEQNYTFTPEIAGENMKLEFLLYMDGVKEMYRSLHLWLTVSS